MPEIGDNLEKGAVAVSGGIDSAVSAKLLKDRGYNLLGLFMRQGFPNKKDEEAAEKVCRALNIEFKPVDLSESFQQEVVDYFLEEYDRGRTPNPCIKCNKTIKFGELLKISRQLGANFLATGHYARITREAGGEYGLYCGKDSKKDQSYFLYKLTQDQLRQVKFPIGGIKKEEVRQIAEDSGLPNKAFESQDVCFFAEFSGKQAHNDFLRRHLDMNPGIIKEVCSRNPNSMSHKTRIVGEHRGLALYTIGQRKGIEVGGIGPFYVAAKDNFNNILYVVKDPNNPLLMSGEAVLEEVNWISGKKPQLPLACQAVIRYRHEPVKCQVLCKRKGYEVVFNKPQRAVTAGQSVVFYSGDKVMGGGVVQCVPIHERIKDKD